MPKVVVFNHVSLDGYFTDAQGDMSFAHKDPKDAEWNAFVAGNAGGNGMLLFGRITYEMMAGFWPTPMAAQMMPEVAAGMNAMRKAVFSRTMKQAEWQNTTLLTGDLAAEVRRLKAGSGPDMVILGSGSIVSQLTQLRLIDAYQIIVNPVVLGGGQTMFEGVTGRPPLTRTSTRTFANGAVLLTYEAGA